MTRHRWKARHISSCTSTSTALFVQLFLCARGCYSSAQWFEYRINIYCLLCLSLKFIACSYFQRKKPQPHLNGNGDDVVQVDCRLRIWAIAFLLLLLLLLCFVSTMFTDKNGLFSHLLSLDFHKLLVQSFRCQAFWVSIKSCNCCEVVRVWTKYMLDLHYW